jgi:hypothetical protein
VSEVAPSIGTLRERPLHADLKRWYSEADDRIEVAVDGYVIDIVRDDLLIEIQTSGFSGMRGKLRRLLSSGRRVRVVHPIATDRWIVRLGAAGEILGRRRSPRHGTLIDLVSELVSFPELLADPGFEIEVLMTAEDEYRRQDVGRCWRRRGWVIVERRLIRVTDRAIFSRPEDLARLLPADLPDRFTTADLADRTGRPRRVAQQLAYCLRAVGVIEQVSQQGRAMAYGIPAWDEDGPGATGGTSVDPFLPRAYATRNVPGADR